MARGTMNRGAREHIGSTLDSLFEELGEKAEVDLRGRQNRRGGDAASSKPRGTTQSLERRGLEARGRRRACYDSVVDALRADDVRRARQRSPSVGLKQALEMMETGFELQRARLRRAHPGATTDEIDALLRRWLRYENA